jgi:uncharacterized protein (TIGR03032 family)
VHREQRAAGEPAISRAGPEPAAGGEAAPVDEIPFELLATPGLATWLAEQRISLAFTTYQSGGLYFLCLDGEGGLALSGATYDRASGMCVQGRQLYLAGRSQFWRLDELLGGTGEAWEGHERLYVPRLAWVTGPLQIHDVAIDAAGRVLFVNTLFSCLALPSEGHSFQSLWQPPWISALVPEDRCHLNGVALVEGRPAFVTTVSRDDTPRGWRERRRDGGVLVSVPEGEIALAGLSMPHSPRWHRDRLWLVESGRGIFGFLDPTRGALQPVAFCPGFARGMALHGAFAVIGLSKPRSQRTYDGLELDQALAARGVAPRCGLTIVDLCTGRMAHGLRLEGRVEEIYDVAILPDARRPTALGPWDDDLRRAIVPGPPAAL